MDCDETDDREMTKSTIALLLSFACMAESIATRSYLVRCVMLWILRRAEGSALRFVFGPDTPRRELVLHRNSSADALQLAAAFRELAHRLQGELRLMQCLSSWWEGGGPADMTDRNPSPPRFSRAPSSAIHAALHRLHALTFGLKPSRVLPPP